MSALVPVNGGVLVAPGGLQAPTELKVIVDDALASDHRLWVRGHLISPIEKVNGGPEKKRWWQRWRKPEPSQPPLAVHLETQVSGQILTADLPLLPDGGFEALFTTTLPPARRGWRIARNHLGCAGLTAEACCTVLAPPARATGLVAVLLPLEYSFPAEGPQNLENSELAIQLTSLLRRLERGANGYYPLYYLAVVPANEENHHAKLALAATARGWPQGTFVTLPIAGTTGQSSVLLDGLDRLRWLFAGQLEVHVLNLEPQLEPVLLETILPCADRADVHRLINPEDDLTQSPEDSHPEHGGARLTLPCHVPALRRSRAASLPRAPIVFCHGMLAMSALRMQLPEDLNCFSPLRDFLRERGYRVLFPQVPPTSGVVERAARLREQILAWSNEPINLIAHSMGGLDARYMITHLGMAEHVLSLTTVSTPHRGTHLADWFLANFRHRVPLLLAMEAFGVNVDGFRDCQPARCREFNASTPDHFEVRYFSYGAQVSRSRVSPALRRAWHILTPVEGPNDGMVSLASAHWGEFLGTIHVDHFAQTPDAVLVRPGENFDALGFYTRLIEDLARRGF